MNKNILNDITTKQQRTSPSGVVRLARGIILKPKTEKIKPRTLKKPLLTTEDESQTTMLQDFFVKFALAATLYVPILLLALAKQITLFFN